MGRKSRRSSNSVARLIQRLQWVHRESERTGIPVKELLEIRQQQEKTYASQRRDFLKTLGIGAAAVTAMHCAPLWAAMGGQKTNPGRVAIIGAGMAGLRCAHRLHQYGYQSKVYEGNSRIGGRAFTTHGFFDDGMAVERGGELVSTEHSALRNLVHQLGLSLEDVGGGALPDGEELYYVNSQLYTEEQLNDDWRDVYDLFRRIQMDAPWQPTYDNHNAEHLRLDHINTLDWMDQVGIGANSNFGQLMQSDLISEYGLAPEEQTCLNLIYLLAWNPINTALPLAGTDERFHIVGGNDAVIYAMLDELPEGTVETKKVLIAVTGPAQGPYVCSFDDGSTDTCDQLVLALPFSKLRDVEFSADIWNAFSNEKQTAINEMKLGSNGKIHIQTDSRPWADTRLVNGHEVKMNGVSYSGGQEFVTVWDTQVNSPLTGSVMCNYLGGHQGRNLTANQPFTVASKKDVNLFLDQIEPVFPGTTQAYEGKALVSKWDTNPWSKGSYSTPGLGDFTRFWGSQWQKESGHNIHFCGEHCSKEFWGFLNGAVETGELAAQALVQG
jgi:monoamine oxidase